MPLFPLLLRGEQAIAHVAEEFDFHNVHFLHRDARDFGPRLVGVGVVVQEFVAQHQRHRQQAVLAARLAFDRGIGELQPVDEQQGEEDDILRDLGGGQDGGDPFLEAQGGVCVGDEGSGRLARRGGVDDVLE